MNRMSKRQFSSITSNFEVLVKGDRFIKRFNAIYQLELMVMFESLDINHAVVLTIILKRAVD